MHLPDTDTAFCHWKVNEEESDRKFGGCFPVAPVYVICCTNPQVTVEQNQYNPGKTAYDIRKKRTESKGKQNITLSFL